MKEDQVKKITDERNKMKKAEDTYLKQMSESDKLISSGKPLKSMTIKDLSIIIKPFKQNGDNALPKKKKDLIELYEKWNSCPHWEFDYTEFNQFLSLLENNNDNGDNDNTNSSIFDVTSVVKV